MSAPAFLRTPAWVTLALVGLVLAPVTASFTTLWAADLAAQLSDAELQARIDRAEAEPSPDRYLEATVAARLMRDYDAARGHLEATWQMTGPIVDGIIDNSLMLELASGNGVAGAQRAFRDLRRFFYFRPVQIAAWAGSFPEILASGEYDALMLRLSPEADEADYRCACYNTVAWVHRLAGRHDQAAETWARLVQTTPSGLSSTNLDVQAQVRAQYARNLARAGRDQEAREQLRRSMETEVSDAALPSVRRRWAQAYAELGDAEGAVEHLEPLLAANSLISVHTLESRVAWMLVRDAPAFRALLDRHR